MIEVNVVDQKMDWRVCRHLTVKKIQVSASQPKGNNAVLKDYRFK